MDERLKIKLSLINGRIMAFDADGYLKIRTEHHVLGKLIGVPVSHPRNHLINGLPALFTDFEAKLLQEKGIVVIEDKTSLLRPPSEHEKEQYQMHKEKVIDELQTPYIKARLGTTKLNMDKIIKGKIKKLIKSGIPEEEINVTPAQILEQETERIQQSLALHSKTYTQIPTQHPFPVSTNEVDSISVSNENKFRVFKDLWSKGFYITNGDSFGSDFLTYPGDPFHFHASQIVHVVDPNAQLEMNYLVSCGRLSVTVKKACVFAYPNYDGTITYQTLTWDNPKLRDLYGLNPESNQVLDQS